VPHKRGQDDPRLKVLFLCTGNSCRSQMAEAWTRALKGDVIEPFSAGIEAHGLNPLAVQVMAEVGIDISTHRSKLVWEILPLGPDYVITICDNARQQCPVFPGRAKLVHRGFADPPLLAAHARTEQEVLAHYRSVRDEIRDFVLSLPAALADANKEVH
jgi:arsenate reductase